MEASPASTATNPCPACGEHAQEMRCLARDYLGRKDYVLAECRGCGLLRTQLGPSFDARSAYGVDYYRNERGKFVPGVAQVFAWTHRRRASQLQRRFTPRRVLEVGCGRGELLEALQARGVGVLGFEAPDAPPWILENPRVPVRRYTPEDSDALSDTGFDLVLLWHVLEHLSDPRESLRDLRSRLRPGGRLMLSVPRRSSLQARMGLATWFHLDVPRHLFHFRTRDLIRLCDGVGLDVESIEAGDLLQDLYGAWQSTANRIGGGRHNALYWALQGGSFWRSPRDCAALLWQCITSPIWLLAGTLLFGVECAVGRRGTITLVARRSQSSSSENT